MRWMVWLALAGACQDYKLDTLDTDYDGRDTDGDDDVDGTDTGVLQDGEYCNGQDDDGDGEIDEGFADWDGDGVADCIDQDCYVILPEGYETEIDDSCGGSPPVVEEPWNAVMEWQWTGLPTNGLLAEVTTTPVIGNLTDDDFNGVIDEEDIPEIVVIAFDDDELTGQLVVLDGETGEELWWIDGFTAFGGPALADIDGDLITDVVAFTDTGYVEAYDNTGTLLWRSTDRVGTDYPQATVADIDADGRPEVLADNLVLDGRTGATEMVAPISSTIAYRMPAVGDIDLDGQQEIVLGNVVYNSDGSVQFSSTIAGTYGHWSAILDTDGDPEGEVVMIGAGRMEVYDPDGTTLTSVSVPLQAGPPCAVDFDGDGYPEIAWSSGNVIFQYELDGTLNWSRTIVDESGLSGCSGYDFDADSVYEIVYADEHTLYILDGETGAVNFSQPGHASGTIWEYPTIADVDGDDSAELVLVSNNRWGISGWAGVTVFGHADDQWPRSGSTWHVHDFAVTNILPSGVVPSSPTPPWQTFNLYRARPWDDEAGVDLQGLIVDVCWTGCADTSRVLISAQVLNTGNIDSKAYIPVTLYTRYGNELEPLDVYVIDHPIEKGWVTDAFLFDVAKGDVGPGGFVLSIDDNGSGVDIQEECDETNNWAEWNDTPPC